MPRARADPLRNVGASRSTGRGGSAARSRPGQFPLFDSLRALAAVSVVLYHVGVIGTGNESRPLGIYGAQLSVGVPIFFLISGFLLYRPFAAARAAHRRVPSARTFLLRRALRILPAYWVALTLLGLTAGLHGLFTDNWWRFYGLVQIYDGHTFGQGLGVAWTLCIEATFYLLLPVYAFALDRVATRRGRTPVRGEYLLLAALAVASLLFRHWAEGHTAGGHLASTLPGTFFLFALGMGLALWSVEVQGREESSRAASFVVRHPDVCWSTAIAVFIALANLRARLGADAEFVGQGIIAWFILLPAVFGWSGAGVSRRVLRHPWVAWVGSISYSLYLYHATLIPPLIRRGVPTLGPGPHWLKLAAAELALAVAVASGSYLLVERPAMRLRNVRLRGARWPRAVSAVAASAPDDGGPHAAAAEPGAIPALTPET